MTTFYPTLAHFGSLLLLFAHCTRFCAPRPINYMYSVHFDKFFIAKNDFCLAEPLQHDVVMTTYNESNDIILYITTNNDCTFTE